MALILQRALLWVMVCLVVRAEPATGQALQVRVNRWLEVQQTSGTVRFRRGEQSQPAPVGTRLEAVGDTLETGSRSSAVLAIDTDAGTVYVSQNTTMQVQELRTAPNGSRLTRLRITRGQARFQIRPFANPDSRLEIETPAGRSAVRGTEFGVNVQPDGTTGVSTLEGTVVTEAQNQSVTVEAGQQTLMIPGQAPAAPSRAANRANLTLRWLTLVDDRTVRIAGYTDSINLLEVARVPQSLDRRGQFDILVPLPRNRQIEAMVTTPVGLTQEYNLAVP